MVITSRVGSSTSLLLLVILLQWISSVQAAADSNPPCTTWSEPTQSSGNGVSQILKDIPLATTWAGLPDSVKQQLSDSDLKKYVGEPSSNEIAKGIVLLRNWWLERNSASADAKRKCSIYSADDRAQAWEAFSADQRLNNDGGSSVATYKAQLEQYRANKVLEYRSAAKFALQQVFPSDDVLSAQQRQQVVDVIDSETAFGLFIGKIAEALDWVQDTSNGPAAAVWKSAFENNVERIGENYVQDEAKIKEMYEQVKTWIAARYAGYPIDIASLFSRFHFTVNGSGGRDIYFHRRHRLWHWDCSKQDGVLQPSASRASACCWLCLASDGAGQIEGRN